MYFISERAWLDVGIASAARAVSYCRDFVAATALALALQSRGDEGYGVAALMLAATLPLAVLAPWLAGSRIGWTAGPCSLPRVWRRQGCAQSLRSSWLDSLSGLGGAARARA